MLRSLRDAFGSCERQIDEIQHLVDQQPIPSPRGEDVSRSAVTDWRAHLHPILESVDNLLAWRGEEVSLVPPTPEEEKGDRLFGKHASFDALMHELAERDAEIPRDEKEAISLSLLYYRRAYEETRDVTSGNQKIQVAYLIGELARRVGDLSEAQQYLNVAIRTGQEFVHQYHQDPAKTALAQKIVELARDQARSCRGAAL
jgi:hypothetical protein